jgi:hypothetical protein
MRSTIRPIGLLAAASILRNEARFGKLSADQNIVRDLERTADDLEFEAFKASNTTRVWPMVARLFDRLGFGSILQA